MCLVVCFVVGFAGCCFGGFVVMLIGVSGCFALDFGF